MKKKALFALAILLCCLLNTLWVVAGPPLLNDQAGLLEPREEEQIARQLEEVCTRFGIDAVILTVDRYSGSSIQEFARESYEQAGYRKDGCILVISMAERDWWMRGFGRGSRLISDSAFYEFSDRWLPELSRGNYQKFFTAYAELLTTCFSYYDQNGTVYESPDYKDVDGIELGIARRSAAEYLKSPSSYGIAILIGSLLALIPTFAMKRKLKTVRPQQSAASYLQRDSFTLRTNQDLFLYNTVSKVAKPKDPPSSSGGHASAHVSSGGFSHGGGGGKF